MAVDVHVGSSSSVDLSVSPAASGRVVTALFATTAFVGAALLFLVEPLVARLLLPSYGGSATVWSTCSLFFQTLLVVAYGYCHWSTSPPRRSWQPRTHLLVLVLPVLVLPLAVPASAAPPEGTMPALWLLRTLVMLIGLPFAVLATTGPLLQKWYSWTTCARADDPYFLFAASNLGSFVGLLAYPLWLEPRLTLAEQRAGWSAMYAVYVVLASGCALTAVRRRSATSAVATAPSVPVVRPAARRLLTWTLLAMLPSSLMLGVTTHLSTDVASIPLLWVVPLALYLGSFVLAFARTSRIVPATATRAAVALSMVEMLVLCCGPWLHIYISITSSLLMLTAVAYAAHARLAVDRPEPAQLTLFYLTVAVGGVLGGLLNGFVAPAIFPTVLEYPMALCAVPLLLVGVHALRRGFVVTQLQQNLVRAICVAIFCGIGLVALYFAVAADAEAGNSTAVASLLLVAVTFGWLLARHPAPVLAAVLGLYGTSVAYGTHGLIEQSRTFYGTYRVIEAGSVHTFVHGTTIHGTQFLDPARRNIPTTYYSRQGPLGDVFAAADRTGLRSVGAVGLGTGTLAAYGRTGQHFTFFELDPEVIRIAKNPGYFTYLADSRARITTVTGDGRLGLARAPARSFDLIVLDAFSSDAIPVHLLTKEAIEMYASRLSSAGSLAFNISNRVFDLRPVLRAAADDMGWRALVRSGAANSSGGVKAQWVVMGPDDGIVRRLKDEPGWTALGSRTVSWTDDYSSVLSVLR